MQNINDLFYLQEKTIQLLRDYYFLLPEAKYKAKHGKWLKNGKLLNKYFKDYQSSCTSKSRQYI